MSTTQKALEALRKIAEWPCKDGSILEGPKGVAEAAITALEAEQAQATDAADLEDLLVIRHLGPRAEGESLRSAINRILSWDFAVNLDPTVSTAAQELVDYGKAQAAQAVPALPDRDTIAVNLLNHVRGILKHDARRCADVILACLGDAAALARIDPEAGPEEQAVPAEPVAQAMKIVTDALRADPEYAWSWHCNITMAMVDEGLDHAAAEHGAQRFLNLLCPGPALVPAHPLRPKAAPQPVAVQPWIPVTERMPDDPQEVVFYSPDLRNPTAMLIGLYIRGEFKCAGHVWVNVTHWMPLPASPGAAAPKEQA